MRDNFIFFRSFYDSINCLGEKSQLKLYKSIMRLNFNHCKNLRELEELCEEIEEELRHNRNVIAQFLLIKPHILKSMKASFNGALGGAPKENKNAFKNKLKEEEKELEKELEKEEESVDAATSSGLNFSSKEYQKSSLTPLQKKKIQEGYRIFGRYLNIFLFDDELKNFETLCMSKELSSRLIDELSDNIAQGKENQFVTSGGGHGARLRAYLRQYQRSPDYKGQGRVNSQKKGLSQEFIDELFSDGGG